MIVTQKMAQEAWSVLAMGDCHGPAFPDLQEADVTSYYRAAVKTAHPDTAEGSIEAFAKVDRAKHVLLHWLRRPSSDAAQERAQLDRCPRCGGTGRLTLHKGFSKMSMVCPNCRGSGELGTEVEKGE